MKVYCGYPVHPSCKNISKGWLVGVISENDRTVVMYTGEGAAVLAAFQNFHPSSTAALALVQVT